MSFHVTSGEGKRVWSEPDGIQKADPASVDSKKMEYGFRVLCWFSVFLLSWGWGTVIFQLSGFYCIGSSLV